MGDFDPTAAYVARQDEYQRFCEKLVSLLTEILSIGRNEPILFESRVKKLPSLQRKLQEFYEDVNSLDEVEDLVGVRLVFLYPSQVEQVAEYIQAEFTIHKQRPHDYRARGVETFGYKSHHLVVSLSEARSSLLEWERYRKFRAEIQLRTVLQHAWAAHSHGLDYKPASVGLEDPLRHGLFSLAAVLENADAQFRDLRDRSDEVDKEYQRCVSSGDLAQVDLTVRSLRAYLDKLQPTLEELRKFAERLGYDPSVQGRLGSMDEFVEYARLCGVTTLGKIVPLARAARRRRGELVALHSEALGLGFCPAALPFDLLIFCLAFGHEVARKRFIRSTYFSPKLRKAFRVVPTSTSS